MIDLRKCFAYLARIRLPFVVIGVVVLTARTGPVLSQKLPDLEELLQTPLSELMQMDVSVASGIEEPLIDAPAAMIVITREEIDRRGYTGIHDILQDLPGFDISGPTARCI